MVAPAADETPQADLAHLALRMDQMQQELRLEKKRRQQVERVVEREFTEAVADARGRGHCRGGC